MQEESNPPPTPMQSAASEGARKLRCRTEISYLNGGGNSWLRGCWVCALVLAHFVIQLFDFEGGVFFCQEKAAPRPGGGGGAATLTTPSLVFITNPKSSPSGKGIEVLLPNPKTSKKHLKI